MWFQHFKNVPKSNRKNLQKGDPKNVTSPGGAQVKGKGVQRTKKGKGKGKGKPKNKSKGKGQGTATNKEARRKDLARGRRNHPRVKVLEKERKEEKLEARPEEIRKVENL